MTVSSAGLSPQMQHRLISRALSQPSPEQQFCRRSLLRPFVRNHRSNRARPRNGRPRHRFRWKTRPQRKGEQPEATAPFLLPLHAGLPGRRVLILAHSRLRPTAGSSRRCRGGENRQGPCGRADRRPYRPHRYPLQRRPMKKSARSCENTVNVVPHDNMRKVIARRLVEAKLTTRIFILTLECRVGTLLAAREEINAAAPKDKDGKSAYTPSMTSSSRRLRLRFSAYPRPTSPGPKVPCSSTSIPISALRSPFPAGSSPPIIRRAEAKSLAVISNEMKDFAHARESKKAQAG